MECPKCKSTKTTKYGVRGKAQRFICTQCGRAFSNTTSNSKKVLLISDTHCGHLWGLTPEIYWTQYDEKAYEFQVETWNWFKQIISKLGPFDILIANGDLIDGRGDKSGGAELITTDRMQQAQMAAAIINQVNANTILITRGTDYHVGKCEQFEDRIYDITNADEIGNKLRFTINGSLFDVRHHVGGSTVPWSEFTGSIKELIFANMQRGEEVNALIRSHVHKYTYGSIGPNQFAITTPSLQGHSRFGTKRCVGRVDFGLVVLEVSGSGKIEISPVMLKAKSLEFKTLEL